MYHHKEKFRIYCSIVSDDRRPYHSYGPCEPGIITTSFPLVRKRNSLTSSAGSTSPASPCACNMNVKTLCAMLSALMSFTALLACTASCTESPFVDAASRSVLDEPREVSLDMEDCVNSPVLWIMEPSDRDRINVD